ncbi:MAG TPA: PHB depolymerase family esterase [Kofleriaceae bacterium]|nr:PHB depolymerase family esterase [Kofleriaceae bacterium]
MRAVALLALAACSHAPAGHDSDASAGDAAIATLDGAGAYTAGTFSSDQGQLDYEVYTPSGYHAGTPVPLVLAITGCLQSIDQLEQVSRFSQLADQQTFVVVYVAQSAARNPTQCWNWPLPADQARDTGEPSLLAGITRTVGDTWSIDPARRFVIGASAGGAMSVILGATYPDVFAAIGVIAGCEYKGAPCGPVGGPDPVGQGQVAYQAMAGQARVVAAIVFHGQDDTVVAPVNGQQVAEQWVSTDDYADDGVHDGSIPAAPSSTTQHQVPGGHAYTVTDYGGAQPIVELVLIAGAGHAWPGGTAGALYADPAGPDATAMSYAFFAAHPAP